jgi:hypothetical protein
MSDDHSASQGATSLFSDRALHQRLLAMPAANDAPKPQGPHVFDLLAAWRERRFAEQCCRRLLSLHEVVSSAHPGTSGRELYRLIVTAHAGGDANAAEALLNRAHDSYALWPVPRTLTFRDVVHYLSVSGYWAAHHGQRWICSDIRRVIDAAIPRNF